MHLCALWCPRNKEEKKTQRLNWIKNILRLWTNLLLHFFFNWMQDIISASSAYYAALMPHTDEAGRGGGVFCEAWLGSRNVKMSHSFLNFLFFFPLIQYLCTQLCIKWSRCALQRKAKSSDKPDWDDGDDGDNWPDWDDWPDWDAGNAHFLYKD